MFLKQAWQAISFFDKLSLTFISCFFKNLNNCNLKPSEIVCLSVFLVLQHQQLHILPSQLVNTSVLAVPAVPGQMGDVLEWVLTHLEHHLRTWFRSNYSLIIQSTLKRWSSLWGLWLASSFWLSPYAVATAAAVAWDGAPGGLPQNVYVYMYLSVYIHVYIKTTVDVLLQEIAQNTI